MLARQAAAQDVPPGPAAPAPTPTPVNGDDGSQTIEINASRVEVGRDQQAKFSGRVEIKTRDGTISADNATYKDGNVEVLGRVNFTGKDFTVFGEDAEYDGDTETVKVTGAGFDIPSRPARGSAQEITVRSNSKMTLMQVLFTTCPADNTTWAASAPRTA
jgi:lipopolysaccharide assembly outer membrane protein LptD (OstA)